MRYSFLNALFFCLVSCSQKVAPEPSLAPISSETDSNVNKSENQADVQCITKCIQSRQAEAIAADVIEHQCRQGCQTKRSGEQLQLIPTIEEQKEQQQKDNSKN